MPTRRNPQTTRVAAVPDPEKIPLIKADLPPFESVEAAFREILANGKITNFGKYVCQFEEETAAFLGVPTVTVSSGTMSLLFLLQACGLRPGQKVILPSFSFMATAQAVLYAGGVPVFVDVGPDLTVSVPDLEKTLERHRDAAAVIGVHVYGLPCAVAELDRVVKRFSSGREPLRLLYDAAHAFGSAVDGKRVGTFGDAEVFSLSVTKALVCVEGGLVATRDAEIQRRIRKMRNYGVEQNYDAWWPGLNGKMSEFHALIGIQNLHRLPGVLETRARKAEYLARAIESRTKFRMIPVPKNVVHTFKDFTVLVPPALKAHRDDMLRMLGERGIETRAYFSPAIHEQKLFSRFADRPLPVTEDLARRVVTLPFFTAIREDQMDRIAAALEEVEGKLS